MNDEQLLFEAGVYYRFPRHDNDLPSPDLREYSYNRFLKGKSFGTGRVFVLGHQPIEFYKLLESWNRKGVQHGHFYEAVV